MKHELKRPLPVLRRPPRHTEMVKAAERTRRVPPARNPIKTATGKLESGEWTSALKSAQMQFPLPSKADVADRCFKLLDTMRKRQEVGHRAKISQRIAVACAAAMHLKVLPRSAWRKFCEHHRWNDVKPRPQIKMREKSALKFCLLVSSGFSKNNKKRANKWLMAVGPLLNEGLSPAQIPSEIKNRGGIEALAKANREVRVTSKTGKTKGANTTDVLNKLTIPTTPLLKRPRQAVAGLDDSEEDDSVMVQIVATLLGEGKTLLGLPKKKPITLQAVLASIKGGRLMMNITQANLSEDQP